MKESVNIEAILRAQTVTKIPNEVTKPAAVPSLFDYVSKRKISEREKAEFCTQLSVMLRSRISLHRALEALSLQASNKTLKSVIESLRNEIRKGNSFSRALTMQDGIFDNLFIMTAEVGQESGRLPEVLSHLAIHLEKINNLKRKFRQALTYPVFVLSVAMGAVLFLLTFIVPTFAELFKSFQLDLPPTTRFVLSVSNFITEYGLYALGGLITILLLSWKSMNIESMRERMENAGLKLPFFGDILLKNHVARFCRTLGTLLQAQVLLLEALDVSKRIISNKRMQEDINLIMKQVRHGSAMSEPLVESKFFPPMVAQMIAVGEETSELDLMLLKVSDYYEKELDTKVETLSSMIEPFLILALSIVVAAILASMYMPMFDLVNVVGGG